MSTRTKTLENILNAKNRMANPAPSPQPIPSPPLLPTQKRSPSHISHVNDYYIISEVHKREEGGSNREGLKSLETQNLRLIQELVRLGQWTHNLLNKLREGILLAINTIQQFQYLKGVNLLYSFLQEISQFDRINYRLPSRMTLREEIQTYRKYNDNPESKGTIDLSLNNLDIYRGVHQFQYPDPSGKIGFSADQFPSFRAIGPVEEGEEVLRRMLLIQAISLQPRIVSHQSYI